MGSLSELTCHPQVLFFPLKYPSQVGTYITNGVLGPVAGVGGGEFERQMPLLGERGSGTNPETGQSSDGVGLSKNETWVC